MTHRRLLHSAAASTGALTLMCTALIAQAPSPTDTRNVTAIGCLKQERDIPDRANAPDGRESAEAFVLVNTRITAATSPDTAKASNDATAPSGSPGASASGTSSTGSTSMQSSDRPPSDAATSSPRAGAQTMYRVTGLPDDQLRPHLNKQVEIRATLDASRMGGAAVRQPGAAMGSEPASAPSASTPPPASPPGQGQAPSTQADRRGDKAAWTSDLPELRAISLRATGGRCQGT
jgi:hypothetical protein